MIRALVLACLAVGSASAETLLVNVARDHRAGVEQVAELRAAPSASWGPDGLAPAKPWLEDELAPVEDLPKRARVLIDEADAKYTQLDLEGAAAKLDAAERVLATADASEAAIVALRELNVRRAEIELTAKRAGKADAWFALAIRLGAAKLDATRFPPAVRHRHTKVLAAERAAPTASIEIVSSPPHAVRCIDAALGGASTVQLVAGEHYVCAASPGYRSTIRRVSARGGTLELELEALDRDAAAQQIRAALTRMNLDDAAARAPARALAKLAGADRLVLVTGEAVHVYSSRDDRLVRRRASKLGLEPAGADGRTLGPAPARPWYRRPWVVVGGLAVLVGIVSVVVYTQSTESYDTAGGAAWL